MKRIIILLFCVLFLNIAHADDFNPKSVNEITMRIVQSGELDTDGYINKAVLSLYIPQEGVQNINVLSNSGNTWNYSYDKFGNKMAVITWQNPSGVITYSIDTTVRNYAKYANPSVGIGSDPNYLSSTNTIVFNDEIRKAAYPYEKTWENVAKLTQYVYNTINYNVSLVGARHSSDWVFDNKQGVCVEHANLLASLLRVSGIPTRYVVGYAYSVVDKRLIGHTWVEVLSSDGNWVAFDPTWLEGGYLDATHIKTANLLDDNQTDVLTYFGSGTIKWKRGGSTSNNPSNTGDLYADKVDILDYTSKNITSIELTTPSSTLGGYGYVTARVDSNTCFINQMEILSCVDSASRPVLEIYDKERKFYSCGGESIYWFYKDTDSRHSYTCPITVFDQIGSVNYANVDVSRGTTPGDISISGPGTVASGEKFTLASSANSDFIFYSPDFGLQSDSSWQQSISRPGSYNYYLFSGGALSRKTVNVVDKKDFDIYLSIPGSVKVNESFPVRVTIRNSDKINYAVLRLDFDDNYLESHLSFLPNEEKVLDFNITIANPGQKEIVASLFNQGLTTNSRVVLVEGQKTQYQSNSILDSATKTVNDLFTYLAMLFAQLLGMLKL